MIPVIGVLAGIIIAAVFDIYLPPQYSPYMAVAIIAALDSVFGGIVANLKKNFNMYIFMSGFFGNALLAVLLTYIGKRLDLDLQFAAVIVFGTRLFQNFAIIRRFLLNKS